MAAATPPPIIQQPRHTRRQQEQFLRLLQKMLSQGYTDTEAMEKLNVDYHKYWKYNAKLYKRSAEIEAQKGQDSLIYKKNLLKERLARLGTL